MRTPILARILNWLFREKKPVGGQVLLEVVPEPFEVEEKKEITPVVAPSMAPAFLFLSPLDDPNAWLRSPAYEPPSGVDVKRCQAEIDSIYGTTAERGGERSIMKLVWNGDRRYWHELFMSWDALGRPNAPVTKRPRVRFKTFRDVHGKIVRDVFPPRWLILVRLEQEQFPNYATESWVMDMGMRVFKQIRPDTPPPVYWLWFATVAEHTAHCCGTADANNMKCFGKYASPEYIYEQLRTQKIGDLEQGLTQSPFEKIDESVIRGIENDMNGYAMEIKRLKIESEISIENPWAMIGPKAAMKLGINTTEKARRMVKDYYDKKYQDLSSDKVNREKREKQEKGIIV